MDVIERKGKYSLNVCGEMEMGARIRVTFEGCSLTRSRGGAEVNAEKTAKGKTNAEEAEKSEGEGWPSARVMAIRVERS